jgi:hypothetical protein
MRLIRINLSVERRMRIRRQSDQRRPALFVALRRLDDGDFCVPRCVHHAADVREPQGPRLVELPLDEVPDIRAGCRLALRTVSEVEAAAHERDVIAAVPPRPRKDERIGGALDDDRRRRPTVPSDVLELEVVELRLRVALELVVQTLLVQVRDAVQHDHAAAGVRHGGDVADELDPVSVGLRVEAMAQLDALRAAPGARGSAQEAACVSHMLNLTPPSQFHYTPLAPCRRRGSWGHSVARNDCRRAPARLRRCGADARV